MGLILGIGFIVLSLVVGYVLKRKMKRYGKVALQSGMSGKEVAARMLTAYGIGDVRILSVPGRLTDHYNPMDKTVNLSPEVYEGRSVAAAAVAAHECGHAVQHAQAYTMLRVRSALVPLQNASARVLNLIFMMLLFGAFALPGIMSFDMALIVIIAVYSVFTLFAFVTLPVELDASKRALHWIRSQKVVNASEFRMAGDALQAAAMTYVVAALSSLGMLLYYLTLFFNRE